MNSHPILSGITLLAALFTTPLLTSSALADTQSGGYTTTQLPNRWLYEPDHVQTSPSEDRWWKEFGDSTLNRLITLAEKNNYNVSAALKRIQLAEKEMAVTRSGYYPTLGASAGWNASQSSGALSDPVSASSRSSDFSAGINMQWEIDLFGKIRRQLKSDKAAVEVSRADYDGMMVALCANIAKNYFQLRTYQMQHAVAKNHIASQEKVLKIAEARQEAGIGDMLEVTQARIVLYSTTSSLPGLEAGIQSTANALAVLTGVFPAELASELLTPGVLPQDIGMPDVGVPTDLLRRRPDIVEAEAEVAQYAALIGVAKNDFLPTFSLNGSIATSARNAGNLFGAHSLQYSVAPTLSWTIFDGMARNNNVAEARLRLETACDNYNMTVLNAVEEVENAIARYNSKLKECEYLEKLITESKKSLDLALGLYKQGLTPFSNVVDAQQSFLANQNSLVAAQGNALTQLVTLYQALGGGY